MDVGHKGCSSISKEEYSKSALWFAWRILLFLAFRLYRTQSFNFRIYSDLLQRTCSLPTSNISALSSHTSSTSTCNMNRAQQATLAITPKITGLLSILGSSWIVVEVLTQKNKRNNVYNRLLCAMSFFDVLSSIALFASTWPIPRDTEDIIFAVGNEKTCVAQGFLIQVGIIAPYCTFKNW